MWSSWFLGNRDPRNDASLLLVIHIEHPTTRSEGFEPPGLLHPSVFKTDALGHSANFSAESTGFEPVGTQMQLQRFSKPPP